MLGLCCNETYITMKKHNNGDEDGDNHKKKDRNEKGNVASRSVSDFPIFDPITMPWSCLGLAEEDRETMKTALRPWCHIYLRVGIYLPYKYPIYVMVNMRHKLLYAKTGVLDFCC